MSVAVRPLALASHDGGTAFIANVRGTPSHRMPLGHNGEAHGAGPGPSHENALERRLWALRLVTPPQPVVISDTALDW